MPRRILIVDDENTIRTTLRIIFEEAGYQILTAGTPAEALRVFRTEALDMVLLDFRLPDNGVASGRRPNGPRRVTANQRAALGGGSGGRAGVPSAFT